LKKTSHTRKRKKGKGDGKKEKGRKLSSGWRQ